MRKLMLAVVAGLLATSPVAARQPKVGEMAPDAVLTLVDGRKVQLSSLRGHVVVLNFWATWCGPCKRELPTLDTYYRIQAEHGLDVFAISTEDSLPVSSMKTLFAAMKMPAVRSIRGPYQDPQAVPTNYIIDRSGRLVYAKAAAFELDDLNRILVPLLRQPATQ